MKKSVWITLGVLCVVSLSASVYFFAKSSQSNPGSPSSKKIGKNSLPSFSFLVKNKDESVEDFLIRNKPTAYVPKEKVNVPTLEDSFGIPELEKEYMSGSWNGSDTIVSFYSVDVTEKRKENSYIDTSNYNLLDGYVYVASDKTHYKKYTLGVIESEGGDPKIESIFFANADKDKEEELVILVSWEQKHYDTKGTLYGVFVYDDIQATTTSSLIYLDRISAKLEPGCDCLDEEVSSFSRFKDKEGILRELKRLGY